MKLADNIRQLRRERYLTQEDFAAVMAVSPQAVSRWERGETMPDVTLLPGIAMFFGITLDELFGMSELQDDTAVAKALEQHQTFLHKGLVSEGHDFLREKLRQFPGNAKLLHEYATWYSIHYPDECLPILKRLLETETGLNNRETLIHAIGNCYYFKAMPLEDENPAFAENMDLAIEWVKKLPESPCRASSLSLFLTIRPETAEDGLIVAQQGIQNFIQWFDLLVTNIINGKSMVKHKAGEQLDSREIIRLREKVIAFYNLVFEEGDYYFYNEGLAIQYVYIAVSHTILCEYDAALDCVERATECAANFMQMPRSAMHTSLLQDAIMFEHTWTQTTPTSCAEHVLDRLRDKHLDPIRDNPRFVACVRRLEEMG